MNAQLAGQRTRGAGVIPDRMISLDHLDRVITSASDELAAAQREDGHWLFDLEADVTIPAEYILLNHFLDERNSEIEGRLAAYIRSTQEEHGGWPLFVGGEMNISCSVKAYWALKLTGDDADEPHMRRARDAILEAGGAARSNVFTRTTLALFGEVPWRAVPSMPVEIMYVPRWFPFHLTKISYWSRTTLVPLMVLMSLRAKARNPTGTNIRELFCMPSERERRYFDPRGGMNKIFFCIDRVLKAYEWILPTALRKRAIASALRWCMPRLNGEDGLGAIFPPMANLLMVLDTLGYERGHEVRDIVRRSVDLLLTKPDGDTQYCQPCMSPIWDTSLAAHALLESGEEPDGDVLAETMDWMVDRQILDVKGDWVDWRPDVPPGGWAFQYNNDHYPDVDDTAVVALALHRADPDKYAEPIRRARDWVIGMQSENGGWGAFDADNEFYYLNYIPFADHGALLDPPTADVSARCISFLCQIGDVRHPCVTKAVQYLLNEQDDCGAWFGRWGINYIYGTWSALCALNAAGVDPASPAVRKAVAWLKSKQMPDGGWGETGESYTPEHVEQSFEKCSTPSQTAWAALALMAAGEVDSDVTRRAIGYLLDAPRTGPKWDEEEYTAVGFPRVFYLRYHGYSAYFPLWALSRYRSLKQSNERLPAFGM